MREVDSPSGEDGGREANGKILSPSIFAAQKSSPLVRGGLGYGGYLFYVGVIVDVIFTITEVAVTPGAVAKFQLRVADIGSAAYGTPVGVAQGLAGFLVNVNIYRLLFLPGR